MNPRFILVATLLLALDLGMAAPTVVITTPSYVSPGYIIPGNATMGSISATANFSLTFNSTANRTIQASYQLLDDSGAAVAITGNLTTGNETVRALVTQSFTKNSSTAVSISAQIVPVEQLDPSRTYRVRVSGVSDVTAFSGLGDLSLSGTEVGGNRYIHFLGGSGVVVRMAGLAFTKTHRLATATTPAGGNFSGTPRLDFYRYEPGGNSTAVDATLQVILRDDLGTIHYQGNASVSSISSLNATTAGLPTASANASIEGFTLAFSPGQLNSVNRTYTLEAVPTFESNGAYFECANGYTTSATQLLDFNGSLRFGSIATTFSAYSNSPIAGAVSSGMLSTTINITSSNGTITGHAGHTYGNGAALSVGLSANGTAYYTGGSAVSVSAPANDSDTSENITFVRQSLTLSSAGLTAGTLQVKLPAGVGYRAAGSSLVFENALSIAAVALNQSLEPATSPLGLGVAAGALHEETKPFYYNISALNWDVASGEIEAVAATATPLRKADLGALAAVTAALVNPEAAFKASNDHVFNGIQPVTAARVIITADAKGNGMLSGALGFIAGAFHPHLPYARPTKATDEIKYGGGNLVLDKDRPTTGSKLTAVPLFQVNYNRACADNQAAAFACGSTLDLTGATILASGNELFFTIDGGLQGNATFNHGLKWGKDPTLANYAHTVSTSFLNGSYLMSGSFLAGGIEDTGTTVSDPAQWMAAGAVLYSGVNLGLGSVIRPGTNAYSENDAIIADYPGLNLRVSTHGALDAKSRLAGVDTPVYSLATRGQYYVRLGGVSGIHQANAFDEALTLYSYDVKLTSLQFSFLSNFNEDSRTEGNINIPSPSNFTIDFSELKITCPGGLDSAEVDNASPVNLEYWNEAPLDVLTMRFQTENGCDPAGAAVLALGVQARAELFEKKLTGELGFRADGQIATRTNGTPAFDSRLKIPNVGLPGPGSKTYAFTPAQDAFFNDEADADAPASPNGFLNLFGTVDVPFFQDLKWHVQTRGVYTGVSPLIYAVAGGYDSAGQTAFSDPFFDESNSGLPAGKTVDTYRELSASGNATYSVEARQDWLGISNAFHYNLQWNDSGKSFSSVSVDKDFFVFNLTHRAKYLCPDTAEITFGLEYDGLPQINISGLASDALDAGVGYTQNLINSLGESATDFLLEGLQDGRDLVASEAEELIAPMIDGPVLTAADLMLENLYALPNALTVGVSTANATAVVASRIRSAGSAFQNSIETGFTGNSVTSMANIAADKIESVQNAIGTLTDNSTGLLQTEGVKNLIRSLVASEAPEFIGVIASQLAGAAFDELINTPGLQEIRSNLEEVRGRLGEVRSQITDGADGIASQLDAILTPVNLQNIADTVADQVEAELGRFEYSGTIELPEIPRVQLRETIRQAILDELLGNQILDVLQEQMRNYVQDAVAAVTNEMNNGLQQVNTALRDVIATHLAEIDQQINQEVLGPMSDLIGAGRLTGYALINGNSLTELRVDGKFEWKVPDDLSFEAYLLIRQLDSDNFGGCLGPGEVANEITIGAVDVPLEWISPNLSADVGVKFTLMSGSPAGMGGYFNMTGGPLSFEAFKINDMRAAVSFGALENYLAAGVDIDLTNWGMAGGIFLGRTCTLDPILLIDSEVSSVLGTPPFTGAYVYGEARIPVLELIGIPSSCMLDVTVGAGAGVFVFVEGPTFGGKFVGEVSGEALCLVSIGGRMSLVGVKEGLSATSPMRFAGSGGVKGKVGCCPFCVKFNKTVKIKFEVSGGEISSPEIDY